MYAQFHIVFVSADACVAYSQFPMCCLKSIMLETVDKKS